MELEREASGKKEVQSAEKTDSSADKSQPEIPVKQQLTVKKEKNSSSAPDDYVYNPKGKIDPFLPWKADVPDSAEPGKQVKKRLPLTPLEKVDLSQLKLVGVIRSASGNKALVEETTGKGYVISKGTYVGLNGGKVTEILKDKVIVEEVVNYGVSGVSVRKRELTLQKPPGED
jgi:type IV pilus assembly protein PilP